MTKPRPLADIPDDLRALVHRWSAPVVTGYGFAWECEDCEIVASGMPPDRTAICKGRLVAEIVRLRGLLPESPMPTPGPSSVVAQAAGEGGVRAGIAAAREEVDAARRWWAAAVGIATTDEEANRDCTVADALAVVVAKIDALDPEIIANAD